MSLSAFFILQLTSPNSSTPIAFQQPALPTMGNTFRSMHVANATATESFDFDEITVADSDFVSISRSMCATAIIAPEDRCPDSSSVKSSATSVTAFVWLSWAISNFTSLMTLKTDAKIVEETQSQQHQQHQQQLESISTSKSQSQTPAIEASSSSSKADEEGDDSHQLLGAHSAEHLTLINAKDDLEDVLASNTESECSSCEQPGCDSYDINAPETMFAMVNKFLRKAPSSSTSSDTTYAYAYMTALDNSDGDVCPMYNAWRRESLDETTRCGSFVRFSHDRSAAANTCSAS